MKACRLAITLCMLGATLAADLDHRASAQTLEESPGSSYRSMTPIPRPVALVDTLGLRLGTFRLHLGGSLAGGFDSNVFYGSAKDRLTSASRFSLMPTLRLVTPSPRIIKLSSNFQLQYDLMPFGDEATRSQGGLGVLSDSSVQIGARQTASFTLYDVLRRQESSTGYPGLETQRHLYNEAGLSLAFHPGGSQRTSRFGFTAQLTGGYAIQLWNEELELDSDMFLCRGIVKYHFFPLTAVYLRGTWSRIRYEVRERTAYWGSEANGTPVGDAFNDAPLLNIDSMPLRLYGGMAGLLTRHVDFQVEGGWGFGWFDEGPSFDDWLARVMLGIYLSRDGHLAASWEHGFSDSTFANYYAFDRISIEARLDLGQWITGGLVGFEHQRFATVDTPILELPAGSIPLYNTSEREDPVIRATAYAGFNLTRWFRLSGYYGLTANLTDFKVTVFSAQGGQATTLSDYTKHEVFLSAEFEY